MHSREIFGKLKVAQITRLKIAQGLSLCLPTGSTEALFRRGIPKKYLQNLYEFYFLADKLCLPNLKVRTMDRIQETAAKFDLTVECVVLEFSKAAFMSCFAEANDGVMYLPDDSPTAFDLYVDWVYRKQVPTGHT